MGKKIRIVAISDTHCGHQAGLTPPGYFFDKTDVESDDSFVRRRHKFALLQREMWNWYASRLKAVGPVDVLFHLGDAIDGGGAKSGGTELITTDTNMQCDMAVKCIQQVNAKDIVMVYGTPYHAGESTDCEDIIAKEVGAKKIGSLEIVDVGGVVFNLKHEVGRSSIPHGKAAPLMREWLWAQLWHDIGQMPQCDVFLRGHVHYPIEVYDPTIPVRTMTLPGFQWSSKYGTRRASGIVSMGFCVFEIEKGEYSCRYELAKLENQKVQALKL